MISLSNRERQIVFYLYSKPYTTANTIASLFSVSEKTIRNDIKSINAIFNTTLIASSKKGYYIDEEHEEIIAKIPLSERLDNENNQILLKILTKKEVNVFDLAEELNYSNTALQNRLATMKSLLQRYDLQLQRKKNILFLSGTSRNLRTLYIDLILEEMGSNFTNVSKFQSYFQKIDINEIIDTLSTLLEQYSYYIPDFYLNSLILNLCTVFNFDYADQEIAYDSIVDATILELAKDLNERLNPTASNKTISLYNCLIGVLKNKVSEASYIVPEFEKKIAKITQEVFQRYSLDIDISNFIHMFALHIHNMILRCKHENSIQNNGGLSIKDSCLFIYDVAVSISDEIAKQFQIHLNPYEISLISMHIGFAIENSLNHQFPDHQLKLIVDTGQYGSKDQFIKKLRAIIPYETEISLFSELPQLQDMKAYDLFITTSNLPHPSIPILSCILSPFLTTEDKKRVLDLVNKVIQHKKKKRFSTFFQMYFNKQNFFVSTRLNTREDVLSFQCAKLEEQGIVDAEFKSSVFVREAIASTDITNMYAIPHAMEFIAKQSAISVFINPEGITWGDSKVKIVFLSAINKQNIANLRIIYDFIIDIVSNPDHFAKLTQANNIEEFSNYLFE